MTFLNPFVLFGLAAAAIPILIHLFNIRKLRTIEFSTLSFLKELNKNKIRKIKIRQWLLLALRTLLILLIVLAFSRPALKGNFGSAGARAKSTLVILLDNSASMALNNERGKFLSQAQTEALKIVSLMQENDEIFFLRLSDLPNATTEEPIHDIRKLESLIRETGISYSYRTIEEGLRLASRLLRTSKNFNKEVYIVTDGQATTLSSGAMNKSAQENLFESQVKIFYTQLSQRQSENSAVEKTVIPPSLFQINKPFVLNAVIKNYGTAAVNNHLVSVVFDGARVMQKSVSLGSGESATLEFSLTPNHSGCISGFVEIENDAFEPDDRYFFSVNIPDKIKLLIVSTEEKYSRYIVTALSAAATTINSSPISVSTIGPSQITSTSLSQIDVVIFSGIKTLPPSQQEILSHYLVNGGNVLFFPSADTTSLSYDYLKPFGLTNFQLSRTNATFEKVDLQFPIFQGMFEQGLQKNKATIASPQIALSINAASETDIRSIISLSNGKNFFWLRDVGRGKLLGASVPASTDWSNLPLESIFVPLLYQSVLYLSSPLNTAEDKKYVVGEKIEFTSSQLKKGKTFSPSSIQLFDTEGRKIPVQSYVKTTGDGITETMFIFNNPPIAGIYAARDQNDTILALSINLPRAESNGILAEKEQIKNLLSGVGIAESALTELPPDADVESTVTQSRFGIELWRYLLIAAMIIAVIEMVIARESKTKLP